jgi:hypothetical protein
MQRFFLVLTYVVFSVAVLFAQHGIGTNSPDASAIVDFTASNKGILIPRVALTGSNVNGPIPNPAVSLLVYNTATAGTGLTAVTPGYYYWDGSQWGQLNPTGKSTGDIQYWNGTKWVNIPTGSDGQIFTIVSGVPTWASKAATINAPQVTTAAISGVSYTVATSGGNVTDNGGASILARGVCWSTSPSPTISNSFTNSGTGTGSFVSNLSNLQSATIYYVRAFATNSAGTAYGEEVSFTTTTSIPQLTTTANTAINTTYATSGGNITNSGGLPISARGVCWSTATGPTIANSKSSDGVGTGSFTSNITGLTAGTIYYVRAYATNNAGTAYGNELSFMTAPTIGTYSAVLGGICMYIFVPGDTGYVSGEVHGLVASNGAIGLNKIWGCSGITITGADGLAIGTGNQNTNDIVNGCGDANSAAFLCQNYVSAGFSDWYLPSRDELIKVYNAGTSYYVGQFWTSTEYSSTQAYIYNFAYSRVEPYNKTDNTCKVLAVRNF